MNTVNQKTDIIHFRRRVFRLAPTMWWKSAVERDGSVELFGKCPSQPGKPLAYGKMRGVPFLVLPGSPVSAIGGFEKP